MAEAIVKHGQGESLFAEWEWIENLWAKSEEAHGWELEQAIQNMKRGERDICQVLADGPDVRGRWKNLLP